jgi:pimeloyl-ACP methyl ester carboxylesterase
VFIHGLGCASSCDFPVVAGNPALAGRRKLLVDLLGSGFSDRPADFNYTIDGHARCVAEATRQLALEAVDLFGHSMGGAVAIVAASLLGDRVRHLVLAEPNLEPGGGGMSRRIAAMSEADYVSHGHDELVQSSRSEGNDVWAASLSLSAAYAVHRGATSLVHGSNPPWSAVMAGTAVPKTIIVGEMTPAHPDTGRLSREGVSFATVPRAGHAMAWQNPVGLATAIRQALT